MADSGFDGNKRTVIIISGFMTNDDVPWMDRIKDLWLKLEDCNVIIVTWKDGNRYVYSKAAATTPRIARQISIFLDYLATMQGDSIENAEFASRIHTIGHSLGCHIAGFVGSDLRGQMGRILALDPAGPTFDGLRREHRLDPMDARLVEAIHTNSGKMNYASFPKSAAKQAIYNMMSSLLKKESMARSLAETFNGDGDSIWYGIDLPVAHVDYYANNGKTQPGCTDTVHICDHKRAHRILEGMLQYELDLKEAQLPEGISHEEWRRDKRLLAVSAFDYAGFVSGETLNQRCPAMLHVGHRLTGMAEQQIRHCTMPMDQLTPVDELVRELADLHEVSFDASAGPSGRRYYLKTLAQAPYAGDHYFLRVRLDRSSTWDESCALQAEATFAGNRSATMEIHKELRLFTNGKFFGLSLPFVNPNNGRARVALDRLLQSHTNQLGHELDEESTRLIEQILPSSVSLKIIENKKSSLSISKWVKGSSPGPKCQLVIESLQVHPLVGFRRSLFGLYTNQRPSGDSTEKIGVDVESHLEYMTPKKSDRIWPETLTPAHLDFERRMYRLVIG